MINPFTISEVGVPGSLRAVADFRCPKCGKHTRFTPAQENADGGFTCSHCGLTINIEGTRLSDYQLQLDAINQSLGSFVDTVERKVKRAARDITAETSDALESTPAVDDGPMDDRTGDDSKGH